MIFFLTTDTKKNLNLEDHHLMDIDGSHLETHTEDEDQLDDQMTNRESHGRRRSIIQIVPK